MTKNEFLLKAYLAALSSNPLVSLRDTHGGRADDLQNHAAKCWSIAATATNDVSKRGLLDKTEEEK